MLLADPESCESAFFWELMMSPNRSVEPNVEEEVVERKDSDLAGDKEEEKVVRPLLGPGTGLAYSVSSSPWKSRLFLSPKRDRLGPMSAVILFSDLSSLAFEELFPFPFPFPFPLTDLLFVFFLVVLFLVFLLVVFRLVVFFLPLVVVVVVFVVVFFVVFLFTVFFFFLVVVFLFLLAGVFFFLAAASLLLLFLTVVSILEVWSVLGMASTSSSSSSKASSTFSSGTMNPPRVSSSSSSLPRLALSAAGDGCASSAGTLLRTISALLLAAPTPAASHVGQYHLPLGMARSGGVRQSRWYPRSHPSHSRSLSSLSPERHTSQKQSMLNPSAPASISSSTSSTLLVLTL